MSNESTRPVGVTALLDQSRLISTNEVRVLLGKISRSTLNKLMFRTSDPLPCLRLSEGGPWSFQLDKVLWWMENQSYNPRKPVKKAWVGLSKRKASVDPENRSSEN